MIIEHTPQDTKIERIVCEFHKENPGVPYAGCTCSGSYLSTKKRQEIIGRHKQGGTDDRA